MGCSDIHLLEEEMNFNSRAASLSVSVIHSAVDKDGSSYIGSLILEVA